MALLITETWSERSWTPQKSASRSFIVSGATSEEIAVDALRTKRASYGDTYPSDSSLVAQSPDPMKMASADGTYNLKVNYVPVNSASNRSSSQIGKLSWSIDYEEVEEPFEFDASGLVVVNSAGSAFDPGPTTTVIYPILNILRYESNFDLGLAFAFMNRINAYAFTVPNYGPMIGGQVDPGNCLCQLIKPSSFALGDPFVAVAYRLKFSAFGFPSRQMDLGYTGWFLNPKTNALEPDKFTEGPEHREVTFPIRLDGTGKPMNDKYKVGRKGYDAKSPAPGPKLPLIDSTQWAKYLLYAKYPRVPFSGLTLFQ
jgi:hypothetical protein